MRIAALGLLVLGLLAGAAGCAATGTGNDEMLYGTWRWVRAYPGGLAPAIDEAANTPAGCRCERQLTVQPEGRYTLVERDSLHEGARSGSFTVYEAPARDLHPWIDLEKGLRAEGAREQRIFRFYGRDTLLLRDGDFGAAALDGGADLFVRAPLGRLPDDDDTFDQRPIPVTKVQPRRSEFAREAQITGTVVLHVLVGEDGHVQKIALIQRMTGLNESAVDAAKQWVFKPALRDGQPVAAWFEISFTF